MPNMMSGRAEGAANYETIDGGLVPVKAWVRGVPFEDEAKKQLLRVARLPIIHGWVAAMPDVHWGKGATIGSVIPTKSAIIPAAVGVDLGCGMMAVKTSLTASDLPGNLKSVRLAIEAAVPHGRTNNGGAHDKGGWSSARIPERVERAWAKLLPGYQEVQEDMPLGRVNALVHLGSLGTGNHFIEMCLDEGQAVWFMLHSGSRGVGNRIGSKYIERAKKEAERAGIRLPDPNLAYLTEESESFPAYVRAVGWAQEFARVNRELMMQATVDAVRKLKQIPKFTADLMAVNCHHNYVSQEVHAGESLWITRKGAVRAGEGELGIIPGSMGARSYIVRGKGSAHSFCSCSHGAGRAMSRGEAKRSFTLADHRKATEGVECRKDRDVIDETPGAYKSIESVMKAQSDLVEVVHTLRQVVCVKG